LKAVASSLLLSSAVVNSAVTCECGDECTNTRMVEMGSILCYGFNSCSDSYLRSRNNDIYCTGDRACHIAIKIVAEENIYCNGNRGCELTVGDIESENGNVFCNGFKGCYKANSDISAYKNVICDGDYGCYSADGFITAATGHVSCEGEQSCYDVTGLISAEFDITAGGYYSAAYSEMNSDNLYCEGELSCYEANAECSTIDCSGQESCTSADLTASDELLLVGGHSGSMAKISAATTYAYGAYSASFSDIDSHDIAEMYVYLYGYYAGEYADIYCRSGSTCTVECVGMGCWKTIIYYWAGADVVIEPTECKYGNDNEVTDEGVACPSLVLVDSTNSTSLEDNVQMKARSREKKRTPEYEELTAKITAKNERLKQVMIEVEEMETERSNLEKSLFAEGSLTMTTRESNAFTNLYHKVEAMPVSATLSIGAMVGTAASLAISACWTKARGQKIKYQPLQ